MISVWILVLLLAACSGPDTASRTTGAVTPSAAATLTGAQLAADRFGGASFPSVQASTLEGDAVRVPEDLAGRPALLLIGYVQDAQFDLDRWLLGLLQAGTNVRCLELPTISGWIPSLFASRIDSGMRAGIPQEDWHTVATLYGDDAGRVADLTGKERGLNGRIMLLDAEGRIAWFHDRGYSASRLLELDAMVRQLESNR